MKRILAVLSVVAIATLTAPTSAEAANPQVRLPQYRGQVLRRHADLNRISHTSTINEKSRTKTTDYNRAFPWYSTYSNGPTRSALYRDYLAKLWMNEGYGYLGSYQDPLSNADSRKRTSRFICESGLSDC